MNLTSDERATNTLLEQAKSCPKCGTVDIVRSLRGGFIALLLSAVQLYPYRCRFCRCRFYRSYDWLSAEASAVGEQPSPVLNRLPASAGPSRANSPARRARVILAAVACIALLATLYVIYYLRHTNGESAVQAKFVLEQNINRPGGDYTSFALREANISECAEACKDDIRCLTFSFVRPTVPGTAAYCWLKSAVTPALPDACCISGMKTR